MKIVMSDESSRAFGDVEWFCLGLFIISPAAATGGVGVRCIMACLFVSWSGLGYNCLFQGRRGREGKSLSVTCVEDACRVNQMVILSTLLERMLRMSFLDGLAVSSACVCVWGKGGQE